MSVRTMKTERHDVKTDPRWYPVTRGLNRWMNRLSGRNDLVVRVPRRLPAPAMFVPANATVDIRESTVSRIDPKMGVPDLLLKFPEEMGAAIHEASHAAASTMDLPGIAKKYGPRHCSTFLVLEEGRCEARNWARLTTAERLALSMMIPRFVLDNVNDDPDEELDMSNPRVLVRILGLLAARRDTGIVTDKQVKIAKCWNACVAAIPNATEFEALAIEFASVDLGFYTANEDRLHEIVVKWMELEDALPQPENEGEGEGEGEGGEEGEPGEGKGKGKGKGKPEKKDEDSDKGEDPGEGEDEAEGEAPGTGQDKDKAEGADGDQAEAEPDDGIIGDDDEGVVHSGEAADEERQSGESGALGDYNSVDPETIAEIVAEVIEDLREAAPEARKVHGSRLGEEVRAIHKATARDHAERRLANREAAKRWRSKR